MPQFGALSRATCALALAMTGFACTGEITGQDVPLDMPASTPTPPQGTETPTPAPVGAAQSFEGTLQVVIVGNGETARPEHHLELDDGRWMALSFARAHRLLHVAGEADDAEHEHLGLPSQTKVWLRGVPMDDGKFAVTAMERLEAPADQPVRQALITPTPKKVAVILANFSDNTTQPITPDGARGMVFSSTTSANAYFKEVSFGVRSLVGKVRSDGDVFGWYKISLASTTCDYAAWGNAARLAAQNAGVDLTGYDHIVHYFPRASSCPWSGVGQVPGRYTWINGSSAQTIAHELGHNFGLHHASSLSCTSNGVRVSISASCSSSEYGDPFDVMGRGYRHFNAFHKGRLGWLEAANTVTATADGTFTVVPLETKSAAGIQSLRVAIPGTTNFYYVEFRQPSAFDNFATTSSVVNGVLIHRAPAYTTLARPQLLDAVPSTTSFSDASWTVGRTFTDATAKISIAVQSVSPAGAVVRVDVP